MDKKVFWSLIEKAKKKAKGDCERQVDILQREIAKMSKEDIVDFDKFIVDCRIRAYRWDLWAAGYIINGGCSDDGFEYFRCWLIAQGEKVFEEALKDPESLADVIEPDEDEVEPQELECEPLMYVALEAYEGQTGKEMPRREWPGGKEPSGKRWGEDELPDLFPRLCGKFGYS